jgi:two-component sensor histidine kinase
VNLAMEICEADSAGISLLESEAAVFRWAYLVGKLATFNGATTPRYFSPCGICLDQRTPILMQRPERAYPWIADAGITVPEVLLVPLYINGEAPLGTLWIVARDGQKFDSGHARVMTELAGFSGVALRMIQTEERLKQALEAQEILTKEMSHRVKNLFAITDSMIRISARNAATPAEMSKSLSGRIHALANANALVRRSFGPDNDVTAFADLIRTVLEPYDRTPTELAGPDVRLGDKATNSLALVFHELATNAAKYGALSTEAGSVKVGWTIAAGVLSIHWQERGGPRIDAVPQKKGFGSQLAENSISQQSGTLNFDWIPTGVEVSISVPLANLSG